MFCCFSYKVFLVAFSPRIFSPFLSQKIQEIEEIIDVYELLPQRENGIYWKNQQDDMDGAAIPTPYLQQ